jgi:hypothetical protein
VVRAGRDERGAAAAGGAVASDAVTPDSDAAPFAVAVAVAVAVAADAVAATGGTEAALSLGASDGAALGTHSDLCSFQCFRWHPLQRSRTGDEMREVLVGGTE